MGRYLGPQNKISRSLNFKVFGKSFEKKYDKEKSVVFKHRFPKKTEYGALLATKKKVLLLYGLREKYLRTILRKAALQKKNLEDTLISFVESRLDNVVYRLNFAKTRPMCRQLVAHKHILVNDEVVNIPSYMVKIGDKISYHKNILENDNLVTNFNDDINMYPWLQLDTVKKVGTIINVPTKSDVPEKIRWKDIIEFYSR
jgi:small subunit ribosomal protein S4